MKTAEYQTRCPLCEDQIEIGDDIEYCHNRRQWHHFSCPWTKDKGYRPDMIILDADDDEIIDIMKHEKNKERDNLLYRMLLRSLKLLEMHKSFHSQFILLLKHS